MGFLFVVFQAKNDKNIILSQHIEGHRSDIAQDIDAIMKYIESPKMNETKNTRQRNSMTLSKQSSRANNKIPRIRDKSTETFSRKSSKSKESKLQKSSSLEEVSISKFEDLTQGDIGNKLSKPSHKSKTDKSQPKIPASNYVCDLETPGVPAIGDKCEPESIDAEFLPVIKKNRKKKGIPESSIRNRTRKIGSGYRNEKMLSSYMVKSQKLEGFPSSSRDFQRRKSISSIPSSDKSGDSSDLDSVHSFPVSSNKGKGNKPCVSLYTGSTPQISYADIARSVPSPSRLADFSPSTDNIDECDFDSVCSVREAVPTVVIQLPSKKEFRQDSVDQDYPPLNVKTADNHCSSSDMFVEYTVHVPKRNSSFQSNCVNVEETVLIEMPSSDISDKEGLSVALDNQVSSKRPPVILMNSNSNDSNEVNDLVFGFEINEQLLISSHLETLQISDKSIEEKYEEAREGNAGAETTLQQESPSTAHLCHTEHSPKHFEIVQYVSSGKFNYLIIIFFC